jgi:hypothetical protein
MPQVQLALAAVLRADLDMLFAARIVEADFVVRRGPQDVALIVPDGDRVAVRRVVQDTGNIRTVRVYLLKAMATSVPASSGRCRPYVSPA